MKYIIYQNLTQFSVEVEAENKEDALLKAHSVDDWEEMGSEYDISYEIKEVKTDPIHESDVIRNEDGDEVEQ